MNILFDTSNAIIGTPASWVPRVTISRSSNGATRTLSSPFVQKDVNYATVAYVSSENLYNVDIAESIIKPGSNLVNITPAVATLADRTLTAVANGTAVVEVSNGAVSLQVSCPVVNGSFTRNVITFQSFVVGSLGRHITDAIGAMTSGKSPGNATQAPYSTLVENITAPNCTRNPALFTGALDLSAIGILNKEGASVVRSHPGLLISSRHLVGANHYPTQGPVVFKRLDGSYQTVNITGGTRIGVTDIRVFHMDAAVTGITPFTVLPAIWASYLPSWKVSYGVKMPVLAKNMHSLDQTVADFVAIMTLFSQNSDDLTLVVMGGENGYTYMSPVADYDTWGIGAISGDSGGPIFVPVNASPVLLCTHFRGGGPMLSDYVAQINAAMNTLATAAGDPAAGTYALSHPDLSGFTSY